MAENATNKAQIRFLTRGAYDIQKLRIEAGNRLSGNFKAKLGQGPGQSETELEKEAKEILKVLRLSYTRITDGVVEWNKPNVFKGDEVISTFTELCLVANYVQLERQERDHFNRLEAVLPTIPIYEHFLRDVKGIGPAMAAVIISEIDIEKAEYPSTIWAYAGLDVGPDGRGRSRRKEHLVKREYKDKDGKTQERDSITFNPFLKTKLIGVLGPSFLKTGSPYRKYYDEYKHRLQHRPDLEEASKARIHNMAIRYMVKSFLRDLYKEWRELEGLPVAPSYSEAKLGIKHGKAA